MGLQSRPDPEASGPSARAHPPEVQLARTVLGQLRPVGLPLPSAGTKTRGLRPSTSSPAPQGTEQPIARHSQRVRSGPPVRLGVPPCHTAGPAEQPSRGTASGRAGGVPDGAVLCPPPGRDSSWLCTPLQGRAPHGRPPHGSCRPPAPGPPTTHPHIRCSLLLLGTGPPVACCPLSSAMSTPGGQMGAGGGTA